MRRVVLVGVGFLLMLAGVVFTLQGVGVLGGSVMSGVSFWAVAGPVIALAGLILAVIGLRDRLVKRPLTCFRCAAALAYPGTVTGIATRRFSRLPAHDGPPGGVSPR
jgi:hypothetical protein